ncbi:hypothetical protein [Taibaiella koreensis]|uniref:hypothetical protein n=1 Tax=Taibaiella koreensis TaxID=1268548 RepID=UPI000E59914D|nr:hypothetical protein [Taibaiella koreensis]
MKKAIFISTLCLGLLTAGSVAYAALPAIAGHVAAANTVMLTVEMQLVDHYGNPVHTSGVYGYWAQNVQTGDMYETDSHTPDLFLGLPAGTYTFGTLSNPWCGGNQVEVTLDESMQGDPVFVQLVFWEE